jgi:hypothetical protein
MRSSLEAGTANTFVPDSDDRSADLAGMVLCTFDPDFKRQAQGIHETITVASEIFNQVFRVNRLSLTEETLSSPIVILDRAHARVCRGLRFQTTGG